MVNFYREHECSHCQGSGEAPCMRCGGTGTFLSGESCPHCEKGVVICPACGGSGVIED